MIGAGMGLPVALPAAGGVGEALWTRVAEASGAIAGFALRETVLAAIVFAVVLGLGRLLRERSPRLHYGLWALVLLRLLLPPGMASPLSLRAACDRWLPELFATGARTAEAAAPDAAGPAGFDRLDLAAVLEGGPRSSGGVPEAVAVAAVGAWVLGAVLAGGLLLRRRRVYRRALGAAVPVTDPGFLALVARWRRRFRIRRPVALVIGGFSSQRGDAPDLDLAPFTLGVLRPAIYLPPAFLTAIRSRSGQVVDRAVVEAVIAHELAHVRRLDALWLGLQNAVQVLWFWSPLVWWTAARLNDARERIADEMVLTRGRIAPRQYAASLVAVLALDLAPSRGPLPAPALGNPKRRFAMRIQEILRRRPATRPARPLGSAFACALCAFVLLPLAGGAVAGEAPTPAPDAPAAAPIAAAASIAAPAPAPAAVAPPAPAAVPVAAPVAAPAPAATPAPDAVPAVAPVAAPPAAPATLANPLPDGKLTSGFGARRDPKDGRRTHHDGVDISAPLGTAVLAPAAGRVKVATDHYGSDDRHGKTVVIDHGDGLETLYAHLDTILVERGQAVAAGDRIGTVGSTGWVTGPHLHLEVLEDGKPVDPASLVLGIERPPSR